MDTIQISKSSPFVWLGKLRAVPTDNAKWILLSALAIIVVIGLVVAISSAVATWVDSSGEIGGFCLTSKCIRHASTIFSGSWLALRLTGTITAWLAAVGGIVVALFSYISSARVSAFGNHVSHISIFSNYMSYEVSKRDKVSVSSVDIYGWYTLMFATSRRGSMDISNDYRDCCKVVSDVIESSNKAFKATDGKNFSFRLHQSRLKKAIGAIGVKFDGTYHRIDFLEVERQVFELIDSVNLVFCDDNGIARLPSREYV